MKRRSAIVSASTTGIGLAVAQRLARDGYAVVINGRSEERVSRAVSNTQEATKLSSTPGPVLGVVGDITCKAVWNHLIDASMQGDFDLRAAFINTPTPPVGGVGKPGEGEWRAALDALVRFPDFALDTLVRSMASRGGGAIVLNCSSAARVPANGELYFANTLRAVSLAQAQAYAREFAQSNVRINVVLTGFVDTAVAQEAASSIASQSARSLDEISRSWRRAIPLGRLAEPSEIAAVVAFLLSDDASYMTGSAVEVDGGLSLLHRNG